MFPTRPRCTASKCRNRSDDDLFFFFSNAQQSCAEATTRVPHELSACLHKPLQRMQTTVTRDIARHGHTQSSDTSQTKGTTSVGSPLPQKGGNQPVEIRQAARRDSSSLNRMWRDCSEPLFLRRILNAALQALGGESLFLCLKQ